MKFRIGILAVLTGLPSLPAQSIIEGASDYYEASELVTLSEYLGELKENEGNRSFIHTDLEVREGMFFVLKVDRPNEISQVKIDYIPSDAISPETHVFNVSDNNLKTWIYLGLTGDDWSDQNKTVLAWKAQLLNMDGDILDTWKSFLWEKP